MAEPAVLKAPKGAGTPPAKHDHPTPTPKKVAENIKKQQTLRTQSSLRSQIQDANRSTAITEMASLRTIKWGKYLRHKRIMSLVIFIAAVISLLFFIYWSIGNLARDYPAAFRWWKIGFSNTQKTPYPAGIYPAMTVPTVAVAANYPGAAWVQGLMFKSTTPKRNGCLFLLKMVSQYGFWVDGPFAGTVRLRGIHWNGSSEQLRFVSINKFLPRDAASKYGTGASINWGYVWASWNQLAEGGKGYANPWAMVIWTDELSFSRCPMITGYYAGNATYQHFITCLFEGGLCSIAMDWFAQKTDPDQVILEMFSYVSSSKARACSSAAIAASSIQYASMGFSVLAMVGVAFGPLAGIGLALLGGAGGAAIGATLLKPTDCGTVKVAGGK